MKMFSRGRGRRRETGCRRGVPSTKDVQVDRRSLPQGLQDLIDFLDVQPLLGFPLPAPQHDIVHLLGAHAGPLQHAALGDALDDLRRMA